MSWKGDAISVKSSYGVQQGVLKIT